jgi:hypothetical protein
MRSLAALVSAASTSEPSGFAAVEPKRLSRQDVIGDYRLYYRAFPVYFGSLEMLYLFVQRTSCSENRFTLLGMHSNTLHRYSTARNPQRIF